MDERSPSWESPSKDASRTFAPVQGAASPYRRAIILTLAAILAAHVFAVMIYMGWIPGGPSGSEAAVAFYSCFLVEKSLSLDNLFAFYLVFRFFKVPTPAQNRCLTWGILGAIVLRAVMVGIGTLAVTHAHFVMLIFAAILIYSGGKIVFLGDSDDDDSEDLSQNRVVRIVRWMFGSLVTGDFVGTAFFIKARPEDSPGALSWRATPLFLVLAIIEFSDIVFAADSIPASFGITTDPFAVYTGNMFAILGLRSLYQVIAQMVSDLPHMQKAIGLVLVFIGGKIIAECDWIGIKVNIHLSMVVVLVLLGGGAAVSVILKKQATTEDEKDAV